MSKYDVKFIEELTKEEFKDKLCGKEVVPSTHAFGHLSAKQRKIFKHEKFHPSLNGG